MNPYRLRPVAPTVCYLEPDGRIVSERGELIDPDRWPPGYRCWTSYDTARRLVIDGRGEALCWNREEIRWRHRAFERDEWRRRPSDVFVLKLPFPAETERALAGLVAWRDWLAGYGAAPTGTSGSAAWSLLRARLERPLWTAVGDTPPLLQTLGGRQQLGPAGQGRFTGRLEHYDLPAAYASELGRLRYGGRWHRAETLPVRHEPEEWAADGHPVFARAVVRIPADVPFGPLPRRPRRRLQGLEQLLFGAYYPVGCRLQGVWAWQEIEAARYYGTVVMQVKDLWVHLSGDRQPFVPWWQSIEEGRALGGFAGLLAKITGNALWGRFCMDFRVQGERAIRSAGRRGTLETRPLRAGGGPPPSHDLAETVSARVRARLYRLMMTAGDELLSAHTDGAWTNALAVDATTVDPDWRLKEEARQLDLLNPQGLRYWPRPARASEPWVVLSGQPSFLAPDVFAEAWERAGFPE